MPLAISAAVISGLLRQLGFSARQLRVDRLPDEALHTADPLSVVRIFGVTVETAMRYVSAAHPERCSTPPR